MNEMISRHPLLFTLQDAVAGCGFLAGIKISGTALMEHEDGKWWMNGVYPGAITESGVTPQDAFLHFRSRYKDVLFDIAAECQNFAAFEAGVKSFFHAVDEEEKRRWNKALQVVRENNSSIPKPFKGLPRKDATEYMPEITVERLEKSEKQFTPADNVQDTLSKAA